MAKGRKSGGVNYSKTVTKAVANWKLNGDIINASQMTKETRKEITRVFHAANRRLQNIENSGVFSPAANAIKDYLSSDTVSQFNTFAKFSTAAKSFEEIKRDYAAAIEFLKKPTSTASGAKQFETEIKSQLNIKDNEFEYIKNRITEGSINAFGSIAALIPSDIAKVMDAFKTAEKDIADEIESAAANHHGLEGLRNAVENDIENAARQGFPEDPTPLFDAFDTFI